MKVYVVLEWFYEGDSYLVDSFIGVKSTYEEAKSLLDNDDIILIEGDFENFKGIREPKDWGGYRSESKYEIRLIDI